MYQLGSLVVLKKPHACIIKGTHKKANCWEIKRLGADIKLMCQNCDHTIMLSRFSFEKNLAKVIEQKISK